MTNMKYLQVFSHIITCLVEGEFINGRCISHRSRHRALYDKDAKEKQQTSWKAVWSLVVSCEIGKRMKS